MTPTGQTLNQVSDFGDAQQGGLTRHAQPRGHAVCQGPQSLLTVMGWLAARWCSCCAPAGTHTGPGWKERERPALPPAVSPYCHSYSCTGHFSPPPGTGQPCLPCTCIRRPSKSLQAAAGRDAFRAGGSGISLHFSRSSRGAAISHGDGVARGQVDALPRTSRTSYSPGVEGAGKTSAAADG